jgi:phycocyanin-associated rod protein
MKVSAGTRGTGLSSSRQVALTVTGVSNNDYSRTAEMVMNVPYSRMNETMRRVNNMGGKIVGVSVTGPASDAKAPRKDDKNRKGQG